MNSKKYVKIQEIDCGRNIGRINEALSEGWILLKILVVRKKENDDMVEYPIYILGLPSE